MPGHFQRDRPSLLGFNNMKCSLFQESSHLFDRCCKCVDGESTISTLISAIRSHVVSGKASTGNHTGAPCFLINRVASVVLMSWRTKNCPRIIRIWIDSPTSLLVACGFSQIRVMCMCVSQHVPSHACVFQQLLWLEAVVQFAQINRKL